MVGVKVERGESGRFNRPEMVPLIYVILQHQMVRPEITLTRDGLERKDIPIIFEDLHILREAYDHAGKNELPVLVVAPLSLRVDISRGKAKDWFSWRVNYKVVNGDATVFWKAKQNRFEKVDVIYALLNTPTPSDIKHLETEGYVDENGQVGYVDSTKQIRFGALFVGCELVSEQKGLQIPHQVLVFG